MNENGGRRKVSGASAFAMSVGSRVHARALLRWPILAAYYRKGAMSKRNVDGTATIAYDEPVRQHYSVRRTRYSEELYHCEYSIEDISLFTSC